MRTPVRPNPLGLSSTKLLRVEGTTIHVDRLDLIDGTPVVDIKPYTPGWDMIPSAVDAHRYRKTHYTLEEIRDALRRDALQALGPSALESQRVRAALRGFEHLVMTDGLDPRSESIHFSLTQLDGLVDLMLSVAGATFGNGRLHYDPTGDGDVVFDVLMDRAISRCYIDGSMKQRTDASQ